LAIKGKKRGRGRPRAVATAPRPFLVPPRTPVFRQTAVQVLLIFVVLGAIAGIGAGLRASQDNAALLEDVTEFGSQVEATFATEGVVQLFGPTPVPLPELTSAVAQIPDANDTTIDELRTAAEGWAASAEDAAERISSLEPNTPELTHARILMANGLRMYAELARELRIATTLEGDAQKNLLPVLESQLLIAGETFDIGWQELVATRERVGITPLQGPLGPPPGGVPGLPPGIPTDLEP